MDNSSSPKEAPMPQTSRKTELLNEIDVVAERIAANLVKLERLGASPALLAELRAKWAAAQSG